MWKFVVTSARAARVVVVLLTVAAPSVARAYAQAPLSLAEAIRRARVHNPDAQSAVAAEQEAAERLVQARSRLLPKVDVAESWQRGNHPVFVFSSVLAQRQFTAAGFAVDALNHPESANNFRAAVVVDQALFDRNTSAQITSATIARGMAATARDVINLDLAAEVTGVFGQVLTATATVRSASVAVETARADRELARNRRDAGRTTDADVLQLDLSVARTLESQVQAIADERIARSRLNQLMGEPLNEMFALELAPPAVAGDLTNGGALEEEAVRRRPELALADQQERLAAAEVQAAHAAFLPQVSVQASEEFNGDTWNSRTSAWTVGAVARINLFRGLADKARLAEARIAAERRRIERGKVETMVRLDVQVAVARLESARASEAAGRAAADAARASHRIIRDRYDTGLVDAAMLLRASEAVEQADARRIASLVNLITATANLQRAIGRL